MLRLDLGNVVGPAGADGKSAYEIWLSKTGNEGKTEEEFLESLRGGATGNMRVEKTASDTEVSIKPGILYVFPEMASLSITLEAPENTGIVNEYHFLFRSGGAATTLTLPDTVNVPSGFSVDVNKIYEISILEGCMTYQSWEVS